MTDEIDGVLYRAESFLALGQTGRADALVRGALAQQPGDGRLLLALTKVLNAQSRWAEVVESARATVAADATLLSARMFMAAAAHQLGDQDLMAEQAGIVLAHHPENPVALVYLALSATRGRTEAGLTRSRELYRRAMEHSGGGDPWVVLSAVDIELFYGDGTAAERLVDGGLARFPTDPGLLAAKANLETTDTEVALGIVTGLLGSSPVDPLLRARLDALVARRRRRFLVLLWLLPACLASGLTFLPGGWRVGLFVAVLVVGFFAGASRIASHDRLPTSYRAEAASNAPWRVATRVGSRVSMVGLVLGGLQLTVTFVIGGWVLVVATLGWVVARAANLSHERACARRADAEIAESAPVAAGSRPRSPGAPGPMTRELAAGRRERAFTTPLLLVPLYVVALLPVDASEQRAAAATTGIVAAIVALTAIAESVVSARETRTRRVVVPRAALLVVASLLLVVSLVRLVAVTQEWAAVPGAPIEEPGVDATLPPDFFDDPPPAPRFSMPPLDLPEITVPPVAPPRG